VSLSFWNLATVSSCRINNVSSVLQKRLCRLGIQVDPRQNIEGLKDFFRLLTVISLLVSNPNLVPFLQPAGVTFSPSDLLAITGLMLA